MDAHSLTTHLYRRQDVIVSMIQSLLLRRSAHECLFWLWELVYTMDNITDGIRCIVLLFYSAAPPGLLRFIAKQLSKAAQSEDLEERARVLSRVIVNLRINSPWTAAYLITSFRGDPHLRPDRIYVSQKAPSPAAACLRGAIRARHYQNIGYYLGQTALKDLPSAGTDELPADIWREQPDDPIYVAALIARSMARANRGPAARCFARPPPSDLSSISKTFNIMDKEGPIVPAWRKLRETRLYSVHSTASPEWEPPAFGENAVRNNWVFGCSEGIAWRQRLARHQAAFQAQQIHFPTEELAEQFAALYALEFDEQSFQVQNMSLHPIEQHSHPMRWLESLGLNKPSW